MATISPEPILQPSIMDVASDVVAVVRARWLVLVLVQAASKGASVVLLAPLAAALLNVLLSRGGAAAVGNVDLVGFALSLPGVLAMLLVPGIFLGILYFEQACTLWLVGPQSAGATGAVLATFAAGPRLVMLAVVQLTLAGAAVLPFVLLGAGAFFVLLGDADINFYLAERPPKFWIAATVCAVLALAAAGAVLWLFVRWFFALPALIFEGLRPVDALRASARRARGNRKLVVGVVVVWFAARLTALTAVSAVLAVVYQTVLRWTDTSLTASIWATGSLLGVHAVVVTALAGLDRVLYAAATRRLYEGSAPPHANDPRDVATARASLLRRTAGVVLVIGFVAVAGAFTWARASSLLARQRVTITAHRAGALGVPENSLVALRKAIADGAATAEIDVQRSADGTVWVVHDRDLRRLARSALVVSQSTDAELQTVDIGETFNPQFAGEQLATLEQFLETASDHIALSVELKVYGKPDPALAPAVVRQLQDAGALERSTIISLDYGSLQQVRKLAPTARVGYLVSAKLGDVTRLDVHFLSVNKAMFTPALHARATARSMPVAVWTVDDENEMIRVMAAGADDIVTNNVPGAVRAVATYKDLSDVELLLLRMRESLPR